MKTIAELANLSGRTALLTGGAGHIGLAAAETLIELGARVAIVDKDATACEKGVEVLSRIRKDSAISVLCDLDSEEVTRYTVREIMERFGRLDILIHCAAYTGDTKMQGWSVALEQQTVPAFEAALRVNLTAVFTITQEAKNALIASGHGTIILFSSIYGLVGPDMRLYEGTTMSNAAGYNAAKGGILQLTRYFSTVLAPHIRVNAISPGGVWRNQAEAFHDRYKTRTPLQRMATEEDLKGAIAYLASDLSAYVTGQNLVVDGGWTAW